MADVSGRDLALRVQGLIHGQFGGDIERASRRLGVDEAELKRIIEGTDSPRLDVLAALVHELAVDACWLLTGEYDWESHRRQLEEEETGDGGAEPIARALARLRERRFGERRAS